MVFFEKFMVKLLRLNLLEVIKLLDLKFIMQIEFLRKFQLLKLSST